MDKPSNFFADIPEYAEKELFSTLLKHENCHIERIVSYGQASPDGFWYDQAWDEWVLLLEGFAELDVNGQVVTLCPGDHFLITKRQKHRITKTDPDQPTIWLAIHFKN